METVSSGNAAPVNTGTSSGFGGGVPLEDQLGKLEVVENSGFDVDMDDNDGPRPLSEMGERDPNYDPYGIDEGKPQEQQQKPVDQNTVDQQTQQQPNEWQQKYEKTLTDFEQLRNFLQRPEVLQALQPIVNPQQVQQPQYDPANEFNYMEEDLLDPDSFAKATSNKVANLYKHMNDQIANLNQMIQNIQNEYKPVIDNHRKTDYNNTVEKLVTKYAGDDPAAQGEVRKFFQNGTPEYAKFVEVLQKHPTLSLDEAFDLIRPQAIQRVVDQKVQQTVDNGRRASVPVGRPTTPTVSLRSQKPTVRDAISLALEKHGIK